MKLNLPTSWHCFVILYFSYKCFPAKNWIIFINLLHNRIFLFTVRTQLTDHLELLMKKRRCSDDWWCLNYKSPLSTGTIQPTQTIYNDDKIKISSFSILFIFNIKSTLNFLVAVLIFSQISLIIVWCSVY